MPLPRKERAYQQIALLCGGICSHVVYTEHLLRFKDEDVLKTALKNG